VAVGKRFELEEIDKLTQEINEARLSIVPYMELADKIRHPPKPFPFPTSENEARHPFPRRFSKGIITRMVFSHGLGHNRTSRRLCNNHGARPTGSLSGGPDWPGTLKGRHRQVFDVQPPASE
jgi:hypothetical protein